VIYIENNTTPHNCPKRTSALEKKISHIGAAVITKISKPGPQLVGKAWLKYYNNTRGLPLAKYS
jgi:hypothetical protein